MADMADMALGVMEEALDEVGAAGDGGAGDGEAGTTRQKTSALRNDAS